MDERKITNVYIYKNGMVAVFDQYGEQMPEFQGPKEDVLTRVVAAMPPSAILRSNVSWMK